jgi:nuclear pore complex protein Nup62
MIDEINAASSKINSSNAQQAKQDDPLAQIVRVLNGHLMQLQQIDSGAAALQKRVEGAQREARVLQGERGVGGGSWIDDFGRSYGGRR